MPCSSCARAELTSDDTAHCASKPRSVISRRTARNSPPKLGCGQSEPSCAVFSSASGTMDRRSWPTSVISRWKAQGLARVERLLGGRGQRCVDAAGQPAVLRQPGHAGEPARRGIGQAQRGRALQAAQVAHRQRQHRRLQLEGGALLGVRHAGRVERREVPAEGALQVVEQHVEDAQVALLRVQPALEVGAFRKDDVRALLAARGAGLHQSLLVLLLLDPALGVGDHQHRPGEDLRPGVPHRQFVRGLLPALAALGDQSGDVGERQPGEEDEQCQHDHLGERGLREQRFHGSPCVSFGAAMVGRARARRMNSG